MADPASGLLTGKRIALLTASASRAGGGVFESLATHARLLEGLGATPIVLAAADRFSALDRERFGSVSVHSLPVWGGARFACAPGLSQALRDAQTDLVHLHGVWQFPSLVAARWARETGKPCLISPHGMLEPWILARGRWKKALARHAFEQANWRTARLFHALCPAEARSIRQATGRGECTVIANPAPPVDAGQIRQRGPRIVYLGRLHPKKNLPALLAAWAALDAVRPPQAELIVAGWGEDAHVAQLAATIESTPGARFAGPVFGADKQHLLREAAFLVLPSFSEGLPMAMLESWAAGTPTLMSRHCNLDDGFACGAAIDCGTDQATIAAALHRALCLSPAQWLAMAHAARALAAGPYSAATIARQWEIAYHRLIEEPAERTGHG
ncbi:MAG: glycosyltransferase [Novosphingobium sp.]|nr:glycosyltransferase [Novosphingobium sp.]